MRVVSDLTTLNECWQFAGAAIVRDWLLMGREGFGEAVQRAANVWVGGLDWTLDKLAIGGATEIHK
jgi:hypothetical protein